MSNGNNINEIINELDKITRLRVEIPYLEEKIDNSAREEATEVAEVLISAEENLEQYQADQGKKLADFVPKFSTEDLPGHPNPGDPPNCETDHELLTTGFSKTFSLLLALPITVFWWVFMFAIHRIVNVPDGLTSFLSLIALALIPATFFILKKFPFKEVCKYAEWYNHVLQLPHFIKRYEDRFEKFYSQSEYEKVYRAFPLYEEKVLSIAEACKKKHDEELAEAIRQVENIEKKYNEYRDDLITKQNALLQQLSDVTVIHTSLFDESSRISSILKMGRADSLKEAINLALDDKKKEEEAEENRLHNLRMEQAAEDEARAMREHNAAMEQAAREHNAAMERAAREQAAAAQAQASAMKAQASAMQAQAREAERQTQMAKKQASDAQYAASERCRGCANLGRCGSAYGKAAVGCAAYRPR